MSDKPEVILERMACHLRSQRRVALETDDSNAYYAVLDAITTVNDAHKVVKASQEDAARQRREKVRELALIAPKYKRRVRQSSPAFLRAA